MVSPPYWDIIRYSEDEKDLSNCISLEELKEAKRIYEHS